MDILLVDTDIQFIQRMLPLWTEHFVGFRLVLVGSLEAAFLGQDTSVALALVSIELPGFAEEYTEMIARARHLGVAHKIVPVYRDIKGSQSILAALSAHLGQVRPVYKLRDESVFLEEIRALLRWAAEHRPQPAQPAKEASAK